MSEIMLDLVGRERDLARLWSALRDRSVLMIGPRRVGKTVLMKHMVASPELGWRGLRVDLQALTSIESAVTRTLRHLDAVGLGASSLSKATEGVDEVTIAGVGARRREQDVEPWERLADALARAVEQLAGSGAELLLVCFDEVPWWLDEVAKREGPDEARRALAMLRYVRQRDDLEPRVRFLLTGSVGLARAASRLAATADVNDLLPPLELAPLSPLAGANLFETEVTARGRGTTEEAAEATHRLAAGFPHWIKVLAERAAFQVEPSAIVDEAAVERAREGLLGPRMRDLFADEGWEHMVRRRGPGDAAVAVAVLDAASESEDGVPEEALIAAGLSAGADTREDAHDLVEALVDSWHLDVDATTRRYRFLLPLFRLWWRRHGGVRR